MRTQKIAELMNELGIRLKREMPQGLEFMVILVPYPSQYVSILGKHEMDELERRVSMAAQREVEPAYIDIRQRRKLQEERKEL